MIDSKYSSSPATQRYSSTRRLKVEQKRLVVQILALSGGTLLFMALSFLVIIPAFLRFIGGNSALPDQTAEQLPLQTPVLSAPIPATFSAQITIQGYTTKKAAVVILKNSQETANTTADDLGKFSTDVTLDEGDNVLSAFAKNGEQKSGTSQEFTTVFDNKPPTLEITEPKDAQSIQGKKNQELTIKGTTESKTKLYLNDRLGFVSPDGSFTLSFHLENGTNELRFRAIDQAGNLTEKKQSVNFAE